MLQGHVHQLHLQVYIEIIRTSRLLYTYIHLYHIASYVHGVVKLVTRLHVHTRREVSNDSLYKYKKT